MRLPAGVPLKRIKTPRWAGAKHVREVCPESDLSRPAWYAMDVAAGKPVVLIGCMDTNTVLMLRDRHDIERLKQTLEMVLKAPRKIAQ